MIASNSQGCRRYEGKTCLLTASTQGIGLAMATRFAQEGAKVVVSSRKQKAVDDAVAFIRKQPGASEDRVFGQVAHVDKMDDRKALLKATVDRFGTIDVLVINAAASSFVGATVKTPTTAFDKMFETNVKSGFVFVQESLPFLTPMKRPTTPGAFTTNILFTGSIAGYIPSAPIGIYGATKTAMMGVMKALSVELGAKGVRVNLLAPGLIRTSLSAALVTAAETKQPGADDGIMRYCVLKRVGEPVEMAGVASFLCSADASYVNGESIVAAGGSPRL